MTIVTHNVGAFRAEFPSLEYTVDGHPAVFLDGPGGTQVPRSVIDAVSGYYLSTNANVGGAFDTSRASDALIDAARSALATLLNAPTASCIRFGANMTSLTFRLARLIGETLSPGDEIVVTVLDHEANVAPWEALMSRGVVIRRIDVRPDDCTLDLDVLDRVISARTRLVTVGAASNAVGTINDIPSVVRRARAVGAQVFVDAVHLLPHRLVDVQALDVDFLAGSAYKFFGPHVGIMYARPGALDRLPALKVRAAPDLLEAGTQNHEGIAGVLAAVGFLSSVGAGGVAGDGRDGPGIQRERVARAYDLIAAHERQLAMRCLAGLAGIKGVRVWGVTEIGRVAERTPTFGLTIAGCRPSSAAGRLAARGIYAWDGDFYATGLVERLSLAENGGLLRLGAVAYNAAEELDRALEAIEDIARSPLRS